MKNGSIDIIFILLDYGADLNIKNNKRVTPLYFSTKKMLKLLGLSDGTTSVLND
jgi:ankyrin repeat protein